MTALPTIARADCSAELLAAAALWNEAELQKALMNRAAAYDWHAVHFRPTLSVNHRGGAHYLTAFTGRPGFPDTVLVHAAGALLVVELKAEGKYPDPAQREWLTRLEAVPGVLAGVWRPRDWHSRIIHGLLADPDRTAQLALEVRAA